MIEATNMDITTIIKPHTSYSQKNLNYLLNNLIKQCDELNKPISKVRKHDSFTAKKPNEIVKNQSSKYVPRIIYCENLENEHDTSVTHNFKVSDISSVKELSSLETDQENEQNKDFKCWNDYFEIFYIDACENYIGNYGYYLSNSLKLIHLFPKIDYSLEIIKKQFFIEKSEKKLLITDLDETLIHADLDFNYHNHDKLLNIKLIETDHIIPIIIRPKLYEFLDFAVQYFDIAIFTASCKNYADTVIDYLDPENKYFKYRLYRDSCIFIEPGIYVKDLCIFKGIEQSRIVILDNSILSFAHNLENGILLPSFYNDLEDSALDNVIGYLEAEIINSEDVRLTNSETFGFQDYKAELANDIDEAINV